SNVALGPDLPGGRAARRRLWLLAARRHRDVDRPRPVLPIPGDVHRVAPRGDAQPRSLRLPRLPPAAEPTPPKTKTGPRGSSRPRLFSSLTHLSALSAGFGGSGRGGC